MLPQLGFAEMMVLALLAIIVVGPRDLPKLMRKIGEVMSKIRGMGEEFKDAFQEMGAEDEIKQMREEIAELRKMGNLDNLSGGLESEMRDLDRDLRGAINEPTGDKTNNASSKT